PVGDPAATSGPQGVAQSAPIVLNGENSGSSVNFVKGSAEVSGVVKSVELDPASVTLLDASGSPVSEVVVPNVGTYTLNPEKTAVVFTPTAAFVGTAPAVTLQVTDLNGSKATTTYTPTTTPV
ncbi:hypothetical protein HMPREF0044_0558, partial [Gleimia coleocanis DSM 15436]